MQFDGPEACKLNCSTGPEREADPLPSRGSVAGWHSRLLSEDGPLDYLLNERGLTERTLRKHQIGWDGEAITIPVFNVRDRDELVNLRRRRWPDPWFDRRKDKEVRYRGLRGRTMENGGIQPYPSIPKLGRLVLCAGEFDALILRRHKFPAFTVTSGAATKWSKAWDTLIAGRLVAVMFDADESEESAAESRAAELRAAGAKAWPVYLSRTGLGPKEDATDWFVKHGRTAENLSEVIRAARRPPRRKRGGC